MRIRYALFLRAVNVGGRRVTMDILKEILKDAGCSRVATLIASGNAAVDSGLPEAQLVARLERALRDGLGFEVPLFARTAAAGRCQAIGKVLEVGVSSIG